MRFVHIHRAHLVLSFLALVGLGILALIAWYVPEYIADARALLESLPVLGPVLFAIGAMLAMLLLFPSTPIMVLSGVLFGPLVGSIVAFCATASSAYIAFTITRLLGEQRVEQWLEGHAHQLFEYDKKLRRSGFAAVFFMRMAPLLPKGPSSYLLGLSCVRPRDFVSGTMLGLVPSVIVHPWLGDSIFTSSVSTMVTLAMSYVLFVMVVLGVKYYLDM